MKKIYTLALILMAMAALTSCSKKNNEVNTNPTDWENYGLEGKVKQCITTQVEDGVTVVTTMEFNKEGYLTLLTEMRDDCTPTYICHFDGKGNIVDEAYETQCEGVWHINQTDLVEDRDEQGRLKQLTYQIPGGEVIELELYTYDDKGNLVEFVRQNAHCEKEYEEHNTYDSRGNMIENKWSNDNKPKVTRYTYDDQNRIVGKTNIDANGVVLSRTEIEYDEQGRVLNTKDYFDDVLTLEQTYAYSIDSSYTRTSVSYIDGWEKEIAMFNQYDYMLGASYYIKGQDTAFKEAKFYYNEGATLDSAVVSMNGKHSTETYTFRDKHNNIVRTAVGPREQNRTLDVLVTTREIIYY